MSRQLKRIAMPKNTFASIKNQKNSAKSLFKKLEKKFGKHTFGIIKFVNMKLDIFTSPIKVVSRK